LKDHYQKRSSEWKLTRQWLEDAKRRQRAQKGKPDNNQKVSDPNTNKVLSGGSSPSVTDQTNLEHDNAEILKRQKDVSFGPLDGTNAEHPLDGANAEHPIDGTNTEHPIDGTNAEHPIDIDDYDDNLFLSEDDDQSPSKKRPADVVIKQEQDDSNILPSLENKPHKRWKNLSSGKDRYSSDNDIVNTSHKDYIDPLIDDNANNQPAASERISNDGEDGPMLLTPITPHNIRNKNTSHRSAFSPNLAETTVRFNETVRKQSERRQLQGEDCRDCRRYYEITGPMPIPDATGLNRCGHTNQEQSAELLMEARLQYTSKHRTKYSRAPTPPGFWRVGFPTSQELAETNEQSVLYEKSREDQKRKDDEYLKNREHKWDRI
ncbi:7117_t:CDS:2, partial [Cetraspora pellucida]